MQDQLWGHWPGYRCGCLAVAAAVQERTPRGSPGQSTDAPQAVEKPQETAPGKGCFVRYPAPGRGPLRVGGNSAAGACCGLQQAPSPSCMTAGLAAVRDNARAGC